MVIHSLFGFLTGATASGAGMYYYVIDEYRVSNQLLTEDIYVRFNFTRRFFPIPYNCRANVGLVRTPMHDG